MRRHLSPEEQRVTDAHERDSSERDRDELRQSHGGGPADDCHHHAGDDEEPRREAIRALPNDVVGECPGRTEADEPVAAHARQIVSGDREGGSEGDGVIPPWRCDDSGCTEQEQHMEDERQREQRIHEQPIRVQKLGESASRIDGRHYIGEQPQPQGDRGEEKAEERARTGAGRAEDEACALDAPGNGDDRWEA